MTFPFNGDHINSLRSRNLISQWKIQRVEIFIGCFLPQIYPVSFSMFMVLFSIVPFLIDDGKADLKKVMDRVRTITGEWAIVNPRCSVFIVSIFYHPLTVMLIMTFASFVKY